jgi:hypothetical protein
MLKISLIFVLILKIFAEIPDDNSVVYNNISKDTIITNTIPFTIDVKIQDTESDLNTGTFRINDKPFETVVLDNKRIAHGYSTFTQSDFNIQPITVIVYAEDIFENGSRDTFWIREGQTTFDSSVSKFKIKTGFNIFHNNLQLFENAYIKCFDMHGRIIYKKSVLSGNHRIPNFSDGIYIMEVRTINKTERFQIIKPVL